MQKTAKQAKQVSGNQLIPLSELVAGMVSRMKIPRGTARKVRRERERAAAVVAAASKPE